jgi:acetyl-CoA carboxylase carboxyltransferase component
MQLCDAYDLPILSLCDTPGIMVGPEAERSGTVRHASRMFVTGASLTVPLFAIVLRKGYGLGAQAMAGGSFKTPYFTVAWPTGEFGGMGLEGAVQLGYRAELAAVEDPEARAALYDELVARLYEVGKGISMASVFEIDDVIDPLESRRWIAEALGSTPAPVPRTGKKRPCIDTW